MTIARSTQLATALLFCSLTAAPVRADEPRNEPPLKDTLQYVLDRIHKHAANDDWKKEGFKDDEIEKWLDKLVGSISTAAARPDVRLPVRLADVKWGESKQLRNPGGQLFIGHDVDLRNRLVRNSIVLADGNVDVTISEGSVIIARGIVTVHGFSKASIIVGGVLIKAFGNDGQFGNAANGSVIATRGWAELGQTAYGTMIAAREGSTVARAEGAVFVNAPVPPQSQGRSVRQPSKSVQVPNLPLESLPIHPLGSKIEVLGVMHAEVEWPVGIVNRFPVQPAAIVFRYDGRRYIADLDQPIVDEAGVPAEALRDWNVTRIGKRIAILSRPDAYAVVRIGENVATPNKPTADGAEK